MEKASAKSEDTFKKQIQELEEEAAKEQSVILPQRVRKSRKSPESGAF